MERTTKWVLGGIGALVVLPIAALYLLGANRSGRGQDTTQPAVQASTATPPPPVPAAPPPIAETTGPSCDMRKAEGPCFEMLADWVLEKKDGENGCDRGGHAVFSNKACDRTGSFGMCRASGGFMGRVLFFYPTTKIPNQADARSTCEGTFHGVFTPIGTSTAQATTPPNATTPPAPRDLTPAEAAKLEKAGEKMDQLLKH